MEAGGGGLHQRPDWGHCLPIEAAKGLGRLPAPSPGDASQDCAPGTGSEHGRGRHRAFAPAQGCCGAGCEPPAFPERRLGGLGGDRPGTNEARVSTGAAAGASPPLPLSSQHQEVWMLCDSEGEPGFGKNRGVFVRRVRHTRTPWQQLVPTVRLRRRVSPGHPHRATAFLEEAAVYCRRRLQSTAPLPEPGAGTERRAAHPRTTVVLTALPRSPRGPPGP